MSKFVAIDIETTGLYPLPGLSKIFCIAVNAGNGVELFNSVERVRSLLEDKTYTKIIHNAIFDSYWIRRLHGIKIRNVWCTRLMEQVLIGETLPRSSRDENLRKEISSSLLYTLSRYGLAELKNKEIGASFATKPINEPLTAREAEYAKNDVRHLLQLQAMQEYRLNRMDLMRVASLENNLVETLVDIQNRGIGFSEDIWLKLAKKNQLAYNNRLKRLPPQVANWNSSQQVCKYFQSIGIPLTSLSDAEAVQKEYNNPALSRFVEMRQLYKAVTTYGASWLEDKFKAHRNQQGWTIDKDGRIRTSFEQILNTGRLSSSHPNLQQIPKDELYRSAFVPKKGHVFVRCDYPSQEIAIAAAASKEERWIKAILRGDDIHSLTASIVYAEEWKNGRDKNCTFPKKCSCPIHQEKREVAKITNFTILYGGGAHNISEKTGLPLRECNKIVYKFKKSVPKLTRWLNRGSDTAIKTRMSYSADPFKRRRTLRDPEDWMLSNIGKNNPIQACGANMIKLAMISIHREVAPLVLQVHDELVAEVLKGKTKQAVKHMKEAMEKSADYCTGVPGLIKVKPEIKMNLLK